MKRRPAPFPSREELLLGALTRDGAETEGAVGDLASLASYLDYRNHDGTTADEIAAMLDALVQRGVLALADGRFRMLVSWPPA